MDQTPSNPEIPTTKRNKNKLYIIIGVSLLLAIAVVGAIMSLVNFRNTVNEQRSISAQALKVGPYPYVYACTAFGRDDIKKVGADLKDDMNGESFTATQAIPASQTASDRFDLIKTVEDPLSTGMVTSSCDFSQSDFETFESKGVKLSIDQYPNPKLAQNVFKGRQNYAKGSSFPSLKDTSLVEGKSFTPHSNEVVADILLDNKMIELKYDMGNVSLKDAPQKLDGLASTIVKNLSDTAVSTKPHDFSNLGSIGKTKLPDACNATDFKKADSILGGIHYDQTNVDEEHKYGKISAGSPAISSQCVVHFRYKEDDSKVPDFKGQKFDVAETRFPNQFYVTLSSYPTAEDAKNAVNGLKRAQADTAVDFNYGDTSFAYTRADEAGTYDFASTAHNFMTARGGTVITVSIDQGEVKTPYTSTVKTITTDQAKQLLDSLKF